MSCCAHSLLAAAHQTMRRTFVMYPWTIQRWASGVIIYFLSCCSLPCSFYCNCTFTFLPSLPTPQPQSDCHFPSIGTPRVSGLCSNYSPLREAFSLSETVSISVSLPCFCYFHVLPVHAMFCIY